MSKSLVGQLLGLYRSILLDMAVFYPDSRRSFDRDYMRLETLAGQHGAKLFTLLLPALSKLLERSLETGVLSCAGEPLTRPINTRTKIPRLFQGIWKRIVLPNGCLKQDIDPIDIQRIRTIFLAVKKYEMDCAPEAVYSTVKEYFDVERSLPPASKIWSGLGLDTDYVRGVSLLDHPACQSVLGSGHSARAVELLTLTQGIGDRVACVLGEFLPSDTRFRHGPGAVSDIPTGRGYKYAFPSWPGRLKNVFPADVFAVANASQLERIDDWDNAGLPSEEGASKLCSVPKTQKAPRLIAAEPTANQWAQQSVRSYLTDVIRRTVIGKSIDFGRQDLSGDLALSSSLTRQLATVDLSSASDRLSCWLVERLFRKNWSLLEAFAACRTQFLTNDLDKKMPKLERLRKFASMGSALTFPVQSISFYILSLAAGAFTERLGVGSWKRLSRRVRVYGDDIIVPVEWVPVMRELFTLVHLKINDSKTFVDGYFRESCGTDAYKGYNVSPGQIRRFFDQSSLTTLQGVVDSSNNLYNKGFVHAAEYLLSPVPYGIRKLIPWVPIGSKSFGLQSVSGFRALSRQRWNSRYQRHEYETLSFRAKRTSTRRHEGFANLLQFFTEDPCGSDLTVWASGEYAKTATVVSRGWVATPA